MVRAGVLLCLLAIMLSTATTRLFNTSISWEKPANSGPVRSLPFCPLSQRSGRLGQKREQLAQNGVLTSTFVYHDVRPTLRAVFFDLPRYVGKRKTSRKKC